MGRARRWLSACGLAAAVVGLVVVAMAQGRIDLDAPEVVLRQPAAFRAGDYRAAYAYASRVGRAPEAKRGFLTEGPWATDGGQWAYNCLLARASTIRAGSSEILENILGERVLGLPKD